MINDPGVLSGGSGVEALVAGLAQQIAGLSDKIQQLSQQQQRTDAKVAQIDSAVRRLIAAKPFDPTNIQNLRVLGASTLTGSVMMGKSAQSKIGEFGKTPVVRAADYTVTHHTARRTLDETAATLVQLANVVGTLIADGQLRGSQGGSNTP